MEQIRKIAENAKKAALEMGKLSSAAKNKILFAIASAIEENGRSILTENKKDILLAREKGRNEAYIDRLALNETRISAMSGGLLKLAALEDPVGKVIGGATLVSGIEMVKKRVPFGVVGIVYEARPNVTLDAAGICIKTGNAVVLKGGSDALCSNKEIVRIACEAGKAQGLPENGLSLVCDTSREATQYVMTLRDFIDVLIPRGGAGLIKSVVEHSSIPVIETGVGICHVFVDESAEFDMARRIVVNAKTSRPSVCNAIEGLIVHRAIADRFLPLIIKDLKDKNVEIRGDAYASGFAGVMPAGENDFDTEFLDYVLSLSVAEDLPAAVRHINTHGTRHSEAIVTSSLESAAYFEENVDAAAVYVNASTRFTDGEEFGLGAEIGISTQKLHARGPMGLEEMTTYKYILRGTGQIRS